jgi:hypothetical protein
MSAPPPIPLTRDLKVLRNWCRERAKEATNARDLWAAIADEIDAHTEPIKQSEVLW